MKNPSRLLLVAPSIAIILACSGATTDLFGTCELPPEREAKSGAQRVAPVNPGAAAGFDSVDAQFDIVDDFFPEVTGCSDIHTQSLTHAPGNRIDDAMGDPYRHIDTMTFVPNDGSVATGDLFLHGDGKGYLSIRDVDLRKFLYQDVILADCDKQKCDKQTLQGDSSDWKHAESAPRSYAGEPFNSDRFSCIRNVHGFFAEFNRIAKKIPEYGGSGDLRLHLTNNCREPGNYEFALVSEKDGKLYKDHVSLDIEFYSKILEEIDVELDDLGTGIRVVGTERRKDGSYVYEDVKQKAFPAECGLVNLAPYIGKPQRLITKSPVAIHIENGPIPYDEFSSETNEKSGLTAETIVYVEVEPGPPPIDFAAHGFWFQKAKDGYIERFDTEQSWGQLTGRERNGGDVHAPHTFATFGEVLDRPFAISAFEVDGRYLGRMKDKRLLDDTTRLYGFDYSYLKGLSTAEARVAINKQGKPDANPPRMEFRLITDDCTEKRCVNLVIGNIQLQPGETTSMVLGIGTQPLSDNYENDAYQEFQQYALTYDQNDEFTELVGEYGLGLAVVRRSKTEKNVYTIDFVAYERAVPLWRGTVDIKGEAAPKITRSPSKSRGTPSKPRTSTPTVRKPSAPSGRRR